MFLKTFLLYFQKRCFFQLREIKGNNRNKREQTFSNQFY